MGGELSWNIFILKEEVHWVNIWVEILSFIYKEQIILQSEYYKPIFFNLNFVYISQLNLHAMDEELPWLDIILLHAFIFYRSIINLSIKSKPLLE